MALGTLPKCSKIISSFYEHALRSLGSHLGRQRQLRHQYRGQILNLSPVSQSHRSFYERTSRPFVTT